MILSDLSEPSFPCLHSLSLTQQQNFPLGLFMSSFFSSLSRGTLFPSKTVKIPMLSDSQVHISGPASALKSSFFLSPT